MMYWWYPYTCILVLSLPNLLAEYIGYKNVLKYADEEIILSIMHYFEHHGSG